MAWAGTTSGAFQQVQVNLLPYLGGSLTFRLRLGTDQSGARPGWWVDDIQVTYAAAVPCGTPLWSQPTAYPVPVSQSAVVAHGGAIYSFGGVITTSGTVTVTANVYKYDPVGGIWSALAPLPEKRADASAVSDGTSIYILNGTTDGSTGSNTLYRYNPVGNTYTTLSPAAVGTLFQGAAYLNNKIYRVGGAVGGNSTNTAEVYNIATNIWAPIVNYPQLVSGPMVLAHGGYLYVAGGANNNGTVILFNKTYRYDPAVNTWDDAAIADLPGPIFAGAGDFYNGRWIIAGGSSSGQSVVSGVLAWDPVANTWSSLTTMPQSEALFGAATIGASFYTIGGQPTLSLPYSTNVQQYTEAPCGGTPTPTATTTPGGTVTATPCPITFSDVQPSDYFYTPVQYLYCRGVISGYADNTFRPSTPTTRAQLSKIVALGFALPIQTPAAGAYTFTDVAPGSTFFAVVETAAAEHLVSGYTCGSSNPQTGDAEPCDGSSRPYFRPSNNVTRGQLSKIVVLAAGWPQVNPPTATFSDVPSGNIFYPFIETAFCRGVISGYNDNTFRPANQATRGQISKIVYLSLTGAGVCAAK
ncbi:MAG: S-layer homology domain-containing protein [Chloroflexota bacterium]|nr:S-layer homology domain-containing protein [Chloroflexota bacterium]